ncbi:hypothetical protein A3K33_01780 [Candidatus Azambacteria bacterium RIFOXYC1_FULL_41_20]|nr:MAG: hypothetical protein UU33_C0001G0317 [Candidatus Azambacteria bacterium GW2011_GWF1_41_10]KKS49351.1 MAG: hypothetical protein UV14_C0001G0097 [Candidatus Azambacteria bacterium GW2011_GWF2_42_22]KKS68796.1 MAG: hypothetical protein UV39_C0032G0001 [Candidatus Azambacteria bacterium GW2011_GWA2_42_62]KKT03462.1 MAG: hypothetical protein UV81_C0001G0058 [Candidatus Azambacteria bacterium GW2011_GWD1_43_18]KKT12490.1 MAG: hypothetical protein UV93_C0003G0052 [Candidatus Azambacteria bacte
MKSKIAIICGLTVVLAVVWFLAFNQSATNNLEVNFFDVGQGDSMLIKTPLGQAVLIDGGPDDKILGKLGERLSPIDKKIDIVLLTHPHADHVTGLIEVLKRYAVDLVILNGAYLATDNYNQFLNAVRDNGAEVLIAEAGEAIHFDKNLEFDIIAAEGGGTTNGSDANETSIVGKLIYKDFSIMFMGDAPAKIENEIMVYGDGLKSDIIKVGHHGSKYSSFPIFLKMVAPKAGIIEVAAKNLYGHPSPAALNRFAMAGINIFQTGKNGDIRVLSDGFTANIYKDR